MSKFIKYRKSKIRQKTIRQLDKNPVQESLTNIEDSKEDKK